VEDRWNRELQKTPPWLLMLQGLGEFVGLSRKLLRVHLTYSRVASAANADDRGKIVET
jgi:hypothetical protein